MATSESDGDFESADEELGRGTSSKKNTFWTVTSTVSSESDDDTEYVQRVICKNCLAAQKTEENLRMTVSPNVSMDLTTSSNKNDKIESCAEDKSDARDKLVDCVEKSSSERENTFSLTESKKSLLSSERTVTKNNNDESIAQGSKKSDDVPKSKTTKSGKACRSSQQNLLLGAKKLGTKIIKDTSEVVNVCEIVKEKKSLVKSLSPESLCSKNKDAECRLQEEFKDRSDSQLESQSTDNLSESDMPKELKSNKKFKEIFKLEGWEGLDEDIELPDELIEEKLQPVLNQLSLTGEEPGHSSGGWDNWENWGVTSLINTATMGVSTLTNHVSQGLTLLEGTIGGALDSTGSVKTKQNEDVMLDDSDVPEIQEQQSSSYNSFGFGNIMSGVSSITKLVEFTSNKVMTGGLDTLEAIGKKTMEVLQDGDPGLKKKRAFFTNELDRPILSQILREAKERAETEEKTIEERELARKVHFESLFDDYQGLVHLEALEMLSKQSNLKIQQYLIELNVDEWTSVQETLEEIKELCDLGEEEDKNDEKDLKNRLEMVCCDLGVDLTYEKLYNIWTETEDYLASSSTRTDQEIFQNAISTLARFTAFSIERFHKIAELLLIKERRSTVNEADALVQLTNILSNHIGLLSNSFCDTLNQSIEKSGNPDNINANITTIFLEAANANSYIQDAFRLLIPILQVGTI